MAIRKSTQIKYWSIFESYLNYMPIHKLQSQFNCDRATVFRALKYCRESKLDLSSSDDLEITIEAKKMRLNRMLDRLKFLEAGWEEEKVQRGEDGTIISTEIKWKFNPVAEAAFYREIRELEGQIEELKGLNEWRNKEQFDEDVDYDEIQTAIREIESERIRE